LGPQLQVTPNSVSSAEHDEHTVATVGHATKFICDRCEKVTAEWVCNKCDSCYCDDCFGTIHIGKLKSHEKTSTTAADQVKKHYCSNHPTSEIEFYCKQCNVLTCAKCGIVDAYKNHEHVTIAEYLAKIAVPRLQQLQQDKLPQVKQQLEQIREQIYDTLTQVMKQNTSVAKTVNKNFEKLNKQCNNNRLIITSKMKSQGSVCEFELAAKLNEINQLLNSVQVLEKVNVDQSSSAIHVYKIIDKMTTIDTSIVGSSAKLKNSIEQAQQFAELVQKYQADAVQQIEMIELYKYQTLEQELNKIKQIVQESEKEKKDSTNKIMELETQISANKKTIAGLNQTVQERDTTIIAEKASTQQVNDELAKLKQAHQALVNNYAALNQQYNNLQVTNNEQKQQLVNYQQTVHVSKDKNDEFEAQVAANKKTIAELNQTVQARDTTINTHKATNQQVNDELSKLKQDHHALKQLYYSLQVKVTSNEQQQQIVKYHPSIFTNAGFVNGIKSYNPTMKIESLTIPFSGKYHFKVCGAQGDEKYKGGSGAIIECDIVLKHDDILEILCGLFRNNDGCGGGGSFISINGRKNPLIVAGGGGVNHSGKVQYDASLNEDGGSIEYIKGGTKGGKGQSNRYDYEGAGYFEDAPRAKSFVNGGLEGGSSVGGGGYSGGAYYRK